MTYYYYCGTETEAYYLVGILNSNLVNDAIKPYQSEGVYRGKRDIHRRPFEVCPIEQFDSRNPIHREIARLAKAAKAKVADFQVDGSLAKVREAARDWVREEIAAIDALVGQMFHPTPVRSKKKEAESQGEMFEIAEQR